MVGKYIYVVVSASKANYNSTSWSDVTDATNNTTAAVAKRAITIKASDQTVTYGTAIANTT